jgi:hypothetical protein
MFNMDMGPDKSRLQAIEKDNKESIKEYTQRWREAAAQVNPLFIGKRDDQFIFQYYQGPIL